MAAKRHALRRGKGAVAAMHWPLGGREPRAVMLVFADGKETRGEIRGAFCSSWFAAVTVKAGGKKHFVAAAADSADSPQIFRRLRIRLIALSNPDATPPSDKK